MTEYVRPEDLQEAAGNVINLASAQAAEDRRGKFKREKFNDVLPRGTAWLVKDFLPAIGVGVVYGESTVGKSFFMLWLSLRVALGQVVLKHRTRKGGVIYVAAEGQNGMRKRMQGVRERFEVETTLFDFIGVAPNVLDRADMEALAAELREADAEMKAAGDIGVRMVVIDTMPAAMPGGNENTSEAMGLALAKAHWLAQEIGALVVLVTHPGKNAALGPRGWSGQVGNSDVIIQLAVDEEDSQLRVGTVEKLKDGEGGERFAYRLKRIDMGVDEDGDPISTAYPVFEDAPTVKVLGRRKIPVDKKAGPSIILEALGRMIDGNDCQIVSGVPGVPPNTLGVNRVALRKCAVNIGYADPDSNPASIKSMINKDIRDLIKAQVLRVEGDLIWRQK